MLTATQRRPAFRALMDLTQSRRRTARQTRRLAAYRAHRGGTITMRTQPTPEPDLPQYAKFALPVRLFPPIGLL